MENLRFKFRAWYEKESRMLEWDDLQDGTEELERYFSNKMSDVSPVMQHTGTKDKNGKDIYEGDLITDGGLLVPFELYWNVPSAEWWVKRGDDEGWKIDLSYTKMYEVVGNKFEDKHLLEGGE